MSKRAKLGRKRGGVNKGYWYRSGRGWYVTEGKSFTKLCDEFGRHLKDRVAVAEAQQAFDRYQQNRPGSGVMSVAQVCRFYLDWAKRHSKPSTYAIRSGYLFDFCTGLPPRLQASVDQATPADHIHVGLGEKPYCDLTKADVQTWLDAHPGWKSTRNPLQAIRRAFCYCEGMGLIPKGTNPLRGIKIAEVGKRVTYFTTEAEEAMSRLARPALAMALKVCIATGARPICEFGALEASNVVETPRGQIWHWPKGTKMSGKERTIYVPEEIAEIVRVLIRKYPTGKLFRDHKGRPWTNRTLGSMFARLKRRLIRKGIAVDSAAVFYSCRHTFAKRMLGERKATLEILAGLMGNTPKVCWSHYAAWCSKYVDPLWDALLGAG